MIRAVIFDLGNTLMSFSGDWDTVIADGVRALTRYLREQGMNVGETFCADFIEQRRAGRGISARTDVEYTAERALRDTLALHLIADAPSELIARGLEIYFAPEEKFWIPYDDARRTLAELSARGFQLGLISNATDDGFVQRLTHRYQFDRVLEPIISSAAVPWRKPDPRIFQYVLDAWKRAPDRVLMVGDWASTDVLGAHRAGMPAVLIQERWSESDLRVELPKHLEVEIPDAKLLEPEAVIRHLEELIPLVENWDAERVEQRSAPVTLLNPD